MTLRLILMRHAKSAWDDPTVDDHERRLNERGRISATAVGKWLKEREYTPDLVLCSSAVRTRETWELVGAELDKAPDVQFVGALYLARPERMRAVLGKARGAKSVMMLGHNPGSAMMAAELARSVPTHPQFDHYPTAATTILDFETDTWDGVDWRQGEVVDFIVPRDLI